MGFDLDGWVAGVTSTIMIVAYSSLLYHIYFGNRNIWLLTIVAILLASQIFLLIYAYLNWLVYKG